MSTFNLVSVTDVDTVADKAIEITNGRVARLHGVLAAEWTKIRMGVRLSANALDQTFNGSPFFTMGFCNGAADADIPPAKACAHGIGWHPDNAGWSNGAVTTLKYLQADGSLESVDKYVDGVKTTATMSGINKLYMPLHDGVGDNWIAYAFVELEKTTVNGSNQGSVFTFGCARPGNSGTGDIKHKDRAEFNEAIEHNLLSNILDLEDNTLTSVAMDEAANGEFTAGFIAWNSEQFSIRVHDMDFAVLSAP